MQETQGRYGEEDAVCSLLGFACYVLTNLSHKKCMCEVLGPTRVACVWLLSAILPESKPSTGPLQRVAGVFSLESVYLKSVTSSFG